MRFNLILVCTWVKEGSPFIIGCKGHNSQNKIQGRFFFFLNSFKNVNPFAMEKI